MREMKDSGVAWIGEIPKEWELETIKQLMIERNEKNRDGQTDTILSLSAKDGVTLYDSENHTGNKPREDLSDYKVVYEGDIVVNSMNILSGAVGLSEYMGCVSPVYYIYYPRSDGNRQFFHYLFQSKQFQLSLRGLGNGILIKETESGSLNTIRMRIPSQKLGAQLFPVPPVETQARIVEALDASIVKVDTLISNNEAQIEKLKQYKQSLITEVVTKGLDPTVPMIDSGIEWIGEIPEHWGLNRIKYICKFNPSNKCNMDSTLNVSYAPMECVKNGYMLYREITIDKISSGLTYFEEEDIVMAKVTPCFENGNIAIAENLKNGVGFGSSELFVFRCLQVYNRWLMYFLRSNTFVERAKATMTGTGGLKRVSPNFVNSLTLAIPPKTEQEQISTYLDTKCAQIDSLIAIKQAKIKKLNQYKKSLIYEYVTGKKEVNYNV